jgi:hypothetical protein
VSDLEILKLQIFVLDNTDTILFPLFNSRVLRYNKQHINKRNNNGDEIPLLYNVTTWLVDMCGDHGCVFIRVG